VTLSAATRIEIVFALALRVGMCDRWIGACLSLTDQGPAVSLASEWIADRCRAVRALAEAREVFWA
jgi:hypothetical protein